MDRTKQKMKELLVLPTPLMKVQYNEPIKHVELITETLQNKNDLVLFRNVYQNWTYKTLRAIGHHK